MVQKSTQPNKATHPTKPNHPACPTKSKQSYALPRRQKGRTKRIPWEIKMQLFQTYKTNHGHLLIPQHFSARVNGETFAFGKWIGQVRFRYHKKKLDQQRIDALNSIGFIWNPREYIFEDRCKYIAQMIQSNDPVSPHNLKWMSDNFKKQKLTPSRMNVVRQYNLCMFVPTS